MFDTTKYSSIDFCEHILTEEDYIIESMLNKGHTLRGPTMTEEECIIEDMLKKGYMLRGPDNESDFQEIAPQTASSKELLRYLVYIDDDLDKPIIVDSGLMKFAVTVALLTDESSVYDFDFEIDFEKNCVKHNTDRAVIKIQKIYKIDVSDIKDLIIYKILNRIKREHPSK